MAQKGMWKREKCAEGGLCLTLWALLGSIMKYKSTQWTLSCVPVSRMNDLIVMHACSQRLKNAVWRNHITCDIFSVPLFLSHPIDCSRQNETSNTHTNKLREIQPFNRSHMTVTQMTRNRPSLTKPPVTGKYSRQLHLDHTSTICFSKVRSNNRKRMALKFSISCPSHYYTRIFVHSCVSQLSFYLQEIM
jgi:hypothetical protein